MRNKMAGVVALLVIFPLLGAVRIWAAPPALHTLAFVSPQRGWVGGEGTILATANGGRTWQRQYQGTAQITQLDFLNTMDGWAVSSQGLLQTTDGGRHWAVIGALPKGTVQVEFVTAQVGWAQVGARLFHTLNAGRTWRRVRTPFAVAGMTFLTAERGWVGSPNTPKVAETVDGGRHWRQAVTLPGALPQDDIEAQQLTAKPGGIVWDMAVHSPHAGGSNFDLSRSADGGRHWRKVHMGSPQVTAASPNDLAAADGRVAYVSGFCGACDPDKSTWLIFTRDAGHTGGGVHIPALSYAQTQIVFPNARDGWMLANQFGGHKASILLNTHDGGLTWQRRRF